MTVPTSSARTKRAADMLQLGPLLDRKPSQLSGGQRQRVAIGRAIVREPDVFLFDEPLSNLDAALRVQMRIEIGKLHSDLKSTMIYVTHDQVEAMTMADKIVVLNAGLVEQVGSPLELYHRPRNMFVAGFIGSPKMNFVPVTVRSVTGYAATLDLPGGGRLVVPFPARHRRPRERSSRSAAVPSMPSLRARRMRPRASPARSVSPNIWGPKPCSTSLWPTAANSP